MSKRSGCLDIDCMYLSLNGGKGTRRWSFGQEVRTVHANRKCVHGHWPLRLVDGQRWRREAWDGRRYMLIVGYDIACIESIVYYDICRTLSIGNYVTVDCNIL